jgi:hypothetical protein
MALDIATAVEVRCIAFFLDIEGHYALKWVMTQGSQCYTVKEACDKNAIVLACYVASDSITPTKLLSQHKNALSQHTERSHTLKQQITNSNSTWHAYITCMHAQQHPVWLLAPVLKHRRYARYDTHKCMLGNTTYRCMHGFPAAPCIVV